MNFLEQLFRQFPSYFSNFLELLISPKRTLKQKSVPTEDDTQTHASMTFLVVSFFITLLIIVFIEDDITVIEGFVNQDTSVLTKFVASAAVYSLLIVLVVAIINTTFKVVGGKADSKTTHTAIHYIIGMLIVLFTAIDVIGESIASLDPQVAKYNVVMEKEVKPMEQQLLVMLESSKSGDFEKTEIQELMKTLEQHQTVYNQIIQESHMYKIGAGFQLVGFGIVFLWLLACWRFFAQEAGIGATRSSVAFIACFAALLALSTVIDIINSGRMVQKLTTQKYSDDPSLDLDALEKEVNDQKDAAPLNEQAPEELDQPKSIPEKSIVKSAEAEMAKTQNSESNIVARYTGEIGGRAYQYIVTFENDAQSRGYLFANDATNERYDFTFASDVITGTNIEVYDQSGNVVAQGSFGGYGAYGCLQGVLYQEQEMPQNISICE